MWLRKARGRLAAGTDLRPIQRDRTESDQTSLSAQPQRVHEHRRQRVRVSGPEPRQRHVIRHQATGQHPERDVLSAAPLDHPRGTDPAAVRIQQHRDQHRRVIRRPAVPISPIRGPEPRQVQLVDHIDQEPRKVIRRQPVPHIRRQQEHLITVTSDEVEPHHGILAATRDRSTQPRQPSPRRRPVEVTALLAREVEVLGLLAAGNSNPRIAEELVVTLDTVKKLVSHVLDKLGAANRTEAVTRARQLGLIA